MSWKIVRKDGVLLSCGPNVPAYNPSVPAGGELSVSADLPAEIVAAQEARLAQEVDEARAVTWVKQHPGVVALLSRSPADNATWIDQNVNDLAAAKAVLKALAVAVGVIARRL